jgi:hypothetical protein
MVKFSRDAPVIAADHRGAARHFLGSLIEVGNLALRVGHVGRCGDGREQLLELTLAVAKPGLGQLRLHDTRAILEAPTIPP